ncbi:hypothetical protein PGC35_19395 [Psychrobacillus sp. PGGUH221]|uniref:hypothetical protein n=1 Tax=Psychrobacillus sp. PGGUH221 TaxID=3020058 RepID=UPI0035C6DB24
MKEYESPWSILTKFRTLNSITCRDMFRLFGTKHVKSLKTTIGSIHKSIITLNGFDEKDLIKALDIDLFSMNNDLINNLKKPFMSKNNKTYNLNIFKSVLSFCPICIENKYHSTLHQYLFFHRCPFHDIELLKRCPSCNIETPYLFDDKNFIDGYICACGHIYSSGRLISNRTFLPIFQNKSMEEFIDIQKTNTIFNIAFLDDFEEDSFSSSDIKYDHIDLLNFINKKKTIKAKPFPRSENNLDKIRMKFKKIDTEKRYSHYPVVNQTYLIGVKIFSSISRQYRKTFLKKHKQCIHYYTSNSCLDSKQFCPLAVAYVHWKKDMLEFKYISDVDNKGYIALRRRRINDFEHQVNHYSKFINRNLDNLFYPGKMHPDYVNYFKWNLSSIKAQLFISEFETYLAASIEFINKDEPINRIYRKYGYAFMPKILFNQFSGNNGSYSIYIRPQNNLKLLIAKANSYCNN